MSWKQRKFVERYLSFDLGLTRSLDYYTGMLFEGYAAGMGYSLIGGGRYDNMMQRFHPCSLCSP